MKSRYTFILACIMMIGVLSHARILVVDNTKDSGRGSLRQAIIDANNGSAHKDSIIFKIPVSDPHYVDSTGVWIIRPDSALPSVTSPHTVINGKSQRSFLKKDSNKKGGEIVLDGARIPSSIGLAVDANQTRIWGLTLCNFANVCLLIKADSCNVSECYVGTDEWGGNQMIKNSQKEGIGILIDGGNFNSITKQDSTFSPNVISGNPNSEILILDHAKHNLISHNIIGMSADLVQKLSQSSVGVRFAQSADSNRIEYNIIGGNHEGILVELESNANKIIKNQIGTDTNFLRNWGNNRDGIHITDRSKNNVICKNIIGKNGRHGIYIDHSKAVQNKCVRNLISENANKGIKSASEIIPGPVIEQITTHSISGRSLPNSDVELFADSENQGRFFIDRIKADESGHFEWQGKYQKSGFNVTAIAIDVYGNTSEFSTMDISGQGRPVKQHLPNDFVLGQNFPNPFNTYTQIGYGLPEKCHVKLEILNFIGKKIITLVNGFQDAGAYSVTWNGIDKDGRAVPSGIYLYRMEAVGRVDVKKMILVK